VGCRGAGLWLGSMMVKGRKVGFSAFVRKPSKDLELQTFIDIDFSNLDVEY
jgi:hypothetical protein